MVIMWEHSAAGEQTTSLAFCSNPVFRVSLLCNKYSNLVSLSHLFTLRFGGLAFWDRLSPKYALVSVGLVHVSRTALSGIGHSFPVVSHYLSISLMSTHMTITEYPRDDLPICKYFVCIILANASLDDG